LKYNTLPAYKLEFFSNKDRISSAHQIQLGSFGHFNSGPTKKILTLINSGLFIKYLFGVFAMAIKSQSITGYFLSLYQRKETNPLLSWQVSIQRILSMG